MRNLFDQSFGSDEGIVFVSKFFDEFFVFVQFFEVVGGYGVNIIVFGMIEIVLVIEDVDGYVGVWYGGQFDGVGEMFVMLRVIVFEVDLQFNGFEEVVFFGFVGVGEEFFDLGLDVGDCDF